MKYFFTILNETNINSIISIHDNHSGFINPMEVNYDDKTLINKKIEYTHYNYKQTLQNNKITMIIEDPRYINSTMTIEEINKYLLCNKNLENCFKYDKHIYFVIGIIQGKKCTTIEKINTCMTSQIITSQITSQLYTNYCHKVLKISRKTLQLYQNKFTKIFPTFQNKSRKVQVENEDLDKIKNFQKSSISFL